MNRIFSILMVVIIATFVYMIAMDVVERIQTVRLKKEKLRLEIENIKLETELLKKIDTIRHESTSRERGHTDQLDTSGKD